MRIILLLFTGLFTIQFANAQDIQQQLDSLLQLTSDSIRERNINSLEKSFDLAFELIENIEDSSRISSLENNFGLYHYYKGDYLKSTNQYEKSLSFLPRGDSIKRVIRLKNLALSYYRLGLYSRSISFNEQALDLIPDKGDSAQIASINNSLGLIFNRLEEFEKAIPYLHLAYHYWQNATERRKAIATNNIGNSFHGLGQWDSATFYYQRSLAHAKEQGYRYASPLNNLGETFLSLGHLDSAQHYINESILIKRENKNIRGIAYSLNVLAEILLKQDNLFLAERFLDSVYVTATDIGAVSILTKNFELRKALFQKSGQLRKALDADLTLDSLKQIVYNEEKLKTLELSAQYELQQKEQERRIAEQQALISIREKETQERNARQNFFIALILAFFLLGTMFLLYAVWRQRKQLKALNVTLDERNQKINLLYQENFHFTRNSLSEIVAMLNRQTKRINEGAAKDLLVAERLRIETVNLLYKELFTRSTKEEEGIYLPRFLGDIVENTIDSMLGFHHRVEVLLSIADVQLDRERTLSLGILLNELTLNACKYALHIDEATFFVSLVQEQKQLLLRVHDNGPGFPESLDWQQTDSFGMQLIVSLNKDLNAEMDIKTGKTGVYYYFSIPN